MVEPSAKIKHANIRYHDAACEEYDAKWGIDFGPAGQKQVLAKLGKAVPSRTPKFGRALEIGSGTGYFSLNLLLAGAVESVVCTDISAGMLGRLERSAKQLGIADRVSTVQTEAEAMPLESGQFDFIFGHAVLHHLPDLAASFSEFNRLLKPGGVFMFGGEPSYYGDKLARIPKQFALAVAPAWRRLLRAAPNNESYGEHDGHSYEWGVDVHTFKPRDLSRFAKASDFEQVRVIGEELTASWFGWTNRTLEAQTDPTTLPLVWTKYAHRGWLTMQQLDQKLLEGRLPAELFYNLLVSGQKPAA